jgi:hypothetical protein
MAKGKFSTVETGHAEGRIEGARVVPAGMVVDLAKLQEVQNWRPPRQPVPGIPPSSTLPAYVPPKPATAPPNDAAEPLGQCPVCVSGQLGVADKLTDAQGRLVVDANQPKPFRRVFVVICGSCKREYPTHPYQRKLDEDLLSTERAAAERTANNRQVDMSKQFPYQGTVFGNPLEEVCVRLNRQDLRQDRIEAKLDRLLAAIEAKVSEK